ncbi:MAG: hypothetical protein IT460_05300 [Planctomycetes bacterium]|nr:hypothetical protein [Planctomycetota bacterium]
MIVLRIDVRGHSADVRWSGAEAVVGAGERAAIQRDDAGWAPREAVLIHRGDEVLLVPADGRDPVRLRVGDSTRLGAATLTLVGLVPLPPEADDEEAPTPVARARTDLPTPTPAFALEPDPRAVPATSGTAAASAASGPAPVTTPSPAGGAAPVPPRTLRPSSFEDELLSVLRRSPWWAISVAVHALVIVALMLFVPERPLRDLRLPTYGLVHATDPNEDPLLSGGVEDPEPTVEEPEERTAPEPEPLPPTERDLEPLPDVSSRDTTPAPIDPPPEEDTAPPVVLVGPSGAAPSLRVAPKNALSKPTSKNDLDGLNADEQRALEVNRQAAARVRDAIERGGGALGKVLKGLRSSDVLVVRGTFDHMETVLEELGVPFVLRAPSEVAAEGGLSRHKVVFWNCGENVLAPHLQTRAVEAVRAFVRDGGYLFTTDWALANLVIPAFPGFLATEGRIRPLPELIVTVVAPAAAQGHALLDGVLEEDAPPRWWLESASFDVKVLKRDAVEVLLEAPALERPPLLRSPVVAATFSYGRGRVLHVMGHYYQQKGNLAGAVGAQRLPLNFVRLRVEQDKTPTR